MLGTGLAPARSRESVVLGGGGVNRKAQITSKPCRRHLGTVLVGARGVWRAVFFFFASEQRLYSWEHLPGRRVLGAAMCRSLRVSLE